MFLAFGEIMMRIGPSGHLRFRQCLPGQVEVTFGGGEANVCASLAMLGSRSRYLTALPRNSMAESLVANLRGIGVDTDHILWRDEGRLGIYFVEKGANQRGSSVVYDRSHSAVSLAVPEEYDFDAALDGVEHVHVTGITPAISRQGYEATLELVRRARKKNATVSCDLNFRNKLWNWRPTMEKRQLARECMSGILAFVDLVVANEEDAADVLGIHAAGTDVSAGRIDANAYKEVAKRIATQFAGVSQVAITLRESVSADHNNWGAVLYDSAQDRTYLAPVSDDGQYEPYAIRDIVDRVGGGDSFCAGLLHALASENISGPQNAIIFAVGASCLKHSVEGDINYVSEAEVLALVSGNTSGRVQR